jgi:hypothetical protein
MATSNNSSVYTEDVFGNSSGLTAEELANRTRELQEEILKQEKYTKIGKVRINPPSNQGIAKDN